MWFREVVLAAHSHLRDTQEVYDASAIAAHNDECTAAAHLSISKVDEPRGALEVSLEL